MERNDGVMEVAWGVIVLWTLVVLIVAGTIGGLAYDRWVSAAQESNRNQVFHQSQAYNDGMANELRDYRKSYETATDDATKQSICSMVAHMTANYDIDRLNDSDLRAWVKLMRETNLRGK